DEHQQDVARADEQDGEADAEEQLTRRACGRNEEADRPSFRLQNADGDERRGDDGDERHPLLPRKRAEGKEDRQPGGGEEEKRSGGRSRRRMGTSLDSARDDGVAPTAPAPRR